MSHALCKALNDAFATKGCDVLFRKVLDAMPTHAVTLVGYDGRIEWMNQEGLRRCTESGLTAVVGRIVNDVLPGFNWVERNQRAIADDEPIETIIFYDNRWLRDTAVPIGGNRVAVFADDVTAVVRVAAAAAIREAAGLLPTHHRPELLEKDVRLGEALVRTGGSLVAASAAVGQLPVDVLDSVMRLLAVTQ